MVKVSLEAMTEIREEARVAYKKTLYEVGKETNFDPHTIQFYNGNGVPEAAILNQGLETLLLAGMNFASKIYKGLGKDKDLDKKKRKALTAYIHELVAAAKKSKKSMTIHEYIDEKDAEIVESGLNFSNTASAHTFVEDTYNAFNIVGMHFHNSKIKSLTEYQKKAFDTRKLVVTVPKPVEAKYER